LTPEAVAWREREQHASGNAPQLVAFYETVLFQPKQNAPSISFTVSFNAKTTP